MKFKDIDPLESFKLMIQVYLVAALVILLCVFIHIYKQENFSQMPICLSLECIGSFFEKFKLAVDVFDYLIKALLTGVTIFSFYYALKNYISTTKAAKTTIHLTNLNTFKDYLISESQSMKVLNVKKIDTLKWYNLIYPDSRAGELDISDNYKMLINDINLLIEESNNYFLGESTKATFFDYKNHQTQMIKVLRKIGIELARSPRNNLKEAEKSVFDIINKVNKEFCGKKGPSLIKKQKYN
ncbi:hypothetical protein PUND_a1109 [Pseudoalteromonas undina]|uniref:Uncharacterized protein n=1 Tax=Pseudoalteromonas undina TaxID=43660 RepID=A0ABN0NG45_9GAMM|nr:retron Ec48 family effector membrane protein [Pseudoalteromonas undina]KAF7765433.1 hypothetical protein PUND_a1109 [Pseudoalteromonas undina]